MLIVGEPTFRLTAVAVVDTESDRKWPGWNEPLRLRAVSMDVEALSTRVVCDSRSTKIVSAYG